MPATQAQLEAVARLSRLRSEAQQYERDRLRTAAEPPGTDRDERLRAATTSLSDARSRATQTLAAALGRGTGTELLDHASPLLLLPVRVEARVAWLGPAGWLFSDPGTEPRHLLVRLYPDTIHADSHEPALTTQEAEAARRFRDAIAGNPQATFDAWQELAHVAGTARARWLASPDLPLEPTRPAAWSRPPAARLLPDRWSVTVELDDQGTRHRTVALSEPVADPLPLSVDPLDPDPGPVAWVSDFEAARGAGMAVAVALVDAGGQPLAGRPAKVLALGVTATRTTQETATALSALLDGHRFTDGLAIPEPGAPTTSTPLGRTPYSAAPTVTAELLEAEDQGREQAEVADLDVDPGGLRLARALGLPRRVFASLVGGMRSDAGDERDVRTLLVTALRPVVEELLAAWPDETALALDWLTRRVHALGPLPALLVGPQPYGVLPVTPLLGEDPAAVEHREILTALERLRSAWWDAATERVPRVGRPAPDRLGQLVATLSRDSAPHAWGLRVGVGGPLAAALAGTDLAAERETRRAAAADALAAVFDGDAGTGLGALLDFVLSPGLVPLAEPLVAADRRQDDGPLLVPAQYLPPLADASVYELAVDSPGLPSGSRRGPLLYHLARVALLAALDPAARRYHLEVVGTPAEQLPGWTASESVWENEDWWTAGSRLFTGTTTEWLYELFDRQPPAELSDTRWLLRRLAGLEPGRLDVLLRHVLGLGTGRIDAWYTSLAWERLRRVRDDPLHPQLHRPDGLHVGAYGLLEEFLPAEPVQPPDDQGRYLSAAGGFVHAPSLAHATTAAVLRSAHLGRRADATGLPTEQAAAVSRSLAVRLRSSETRQALELLDGLRSGQALGELLGFRLEEVLDAAGLQRLIAPLRAGWPTMDGGGVDGLRVLRAAGFPAPAEPSLLRGLPALTADERTDLTTELRRLAERLDAVGDLLLAEAVHQLGRGNLARVAGVDDFAAAAGMGVPEPELVRTPRPGVTVGQRVLALLPADADAGDWPSTPRSRAAPHLAAWAAAALPPPDRVVVQAETAAGLVRKTLAELFDGLDANAPERFGPLELLAGAGEMLLGRLNLLVARYVGGPARVRPDQPEGLDGDLFTVAETMVASGHLARALSGTQPLEPEDLDPQGEVRGARLEVGELVDRAVTARRALADAGTRASALSAAPKPSVADLAAALLTADLAATRTVFPEDPGALRTAVAAAAAALREQDEGFGVQPAGDAPEPQRRAWAVRVLGALLGPGLPVVPRLTVPQDHPVRGAAVAQAPADGVAAWLARNARVRTRLRDLQLARLVASAGGSAGRLAAWRLPAAAGGWIERPGPPGSVDSVAVLPAGEPWSGAQVAGLLVDEWAETVPRDTADTSVVFSAVAPSASPPQVLLLAVPPPRLEEWSIPVLERLVDEALHLARLRSVELADLGANQTLPALFSSGEPGTLPDGLTPEVLS